MKGLRWWRRARGYTQEDLSILSGVESSHLAKIERGEIDEPRPDTLRRLAEGLGVEIIDLLFGAASVELFEHPEGLRRSDFTETSPPVPLKSGKTPANHQPSTKEPG